MFLSPCEHMAPRRDLEQADEDIQSEPAVSQTIGSTFKHQHSTEQSTWADTIERSTNRNREKPS
jgi:hypothetical protein